MPLNGEIVAALLGIMAVFVAGYFSIIWTVSRISARQDATKERLDKLENDFKEAIQRIEQKLDRNFEQVISLIKKL